jgi:electron transfer flavoprotein beta subunit
MTEAIRIVVCTKQVPDPEAPASSFRVNSETRSITGEGVPPVISPYDESALELALCIKEFNQQAKITAVSYGPKLALPVLMKSLAVGADELYMIQGPPDNTDGYVTTAVLAAAIRKIGFDLVLAGRQAADTNLGGVGLALSVLLGIPAVSWAHKIEIDGERVKVERVIPNGYEALCGPMPALITVSHEAGELRMPKLTDIRKAKQKPIHSLSLADLETGGIPGPAIECVRLQTPDRERHCRFIEGETPSETGVNLARILIENGVLNI